MKLDTRLILLKYFLNTFAFVGFFMWPISHWFFPELYNQFFGFAGYTLSAFEIALIKIIGSLSIIPICMMLMAAKNPIKNKNIIILLIITGFLLSFTFLYLVLSKNLPTIQYSNVVLTLFLSIFLLFAYPWKIKNKQK